jgi:hypothetical protein
VVTVKNLVQTRTPFAVRSQSTLLGWPADLEEGLVEWIHDNHAGPAYDSVQPLYVQVAVLRPPDSGQPSGAR